MFVSIKCGQNILHKSDSKNKNGRKFGILTLAAALLLSAGIEMRPSDAIAQAAVEEIIVTSQRREQRLQDVSLSISVFTEQRIESLRIQKPADLGLLTPGLSMKATGNVGNSEDPIFAIRGISTNSVEANANPAVTLYLDEVTLPFFPMLGFQLFDMERIEVLKGPQGTLYGRNSTGGAINFVTKKPTQQFTADMRVDYGRFDRFEIEGAVGGGITDTLSARIAGKIVQQDGYQTLRLGDDAPDSVDDRNGDIDRGALRGSFLWEPRDNFSVNITADYGRDTSEVQAFEVATNNSRANPFELCIFGTQGIRSEGPNGECAYPVQVRNEQGEPLTPELELFFDTTPDDVRDVAESFSFGNRIEAENWGLSAKIDWALDWGTITSVTGYRDFERSGGAGNGVPFVVSDRTNTVKADIFTQEIRVSSPENVGAFDWMFGVFYSQDNASDDIVFDFRDHFLFFGLFFWEYDQDTEQIAPFTNVSWRFAENFQLNAGLRFTHEDRSIEFSGDEVRQGPNPLEFFETGVETDDLSFTAGIDYTPNEDWLLYGKFSKGFKGAGFPASIAFTEEALFPFDKETLYAYEAGWKSTLLDNTLEFNGAFYYYDWQDVQAETAVERQGIRLIVLTNAGDAEVVGAEIETNWRPTNELNFRLSANWMDSEMVSGEFDGDTLTQSPKLMVNGFARWDSERAYKGVHPFLQFDFSYQDDIQFELPNVPGANEDEYWIFNARAGVTSANGRWRVAAWIENFTDKTYKTDVFGPGSTFLPARLLFGEPLTAGGSVSYSF